MSELFLTVLNMSLTASYVIIFVILIRLALQKTPKVISYALWVVVAFRLVTPFSFESMFSLLPQTATSIPYDIVYQQKPQINSGVLSVDTMVNEVLPSPIIGDSVNPMEIYLEIGASIWMIGIIALLAYSLVSIFRLKKILKSAQLIEQNIYEADNLKTPFVLGFINPKIYLPVGLDKEEWQYILLHEQTHICRKDHIIKITAFIILTIHWFNPLVWIAFMLMNMDMELSCDERVLKEMNVEIKKSYANSLLTLATGRRILNGSPLAFGEGNVKWRIKNVLNYKKPKFWVVVISIIVVIAVGIGLITNPKTDALNNDIIDLRPMIMVNGELYLDTGKQIPVEIDESAIICEVNSSVDPSEKPTVEGQTNFGSIGLKYAHFENNIVVLINNEWVLFEKETADENEEVSENVSYDKISEYLKEEFINVFSPYYELIDFIISDYKEEVVNGSVEAVFNYKMINKNYDRDPDTVGYIKDAKERGDKNYQLLYDEYLKPKESNFYFKAVIDKNGEITLYSKNPTIDSEWEEVEISNFMLKSPEEVSEINELLKKNRNVLIENDIADYITYNFENRSMYIVGLEIFNEFGTEEFGYINEGSVNLNSENVLTFYITYSTGPFLATGSIPGPEVRFKMNLDTNEIVEKEFIPAPNYAEAAELYPEHINPDSIKYSEKIIELSDERMVEIGLYFKDYILKIEAR
ncbi:M56 family metallopeptidase [Sedimentibacter sp. MB31-C6]|uniref:M56 family metallopeptidase n=1 Tax=Sedimentibacter sp. MB31-C6 TaxID=3109366 RepID=UPI002DDCB9CC|nr:M56 family metallopeptidase [Sedimentibacter sp. MB36-C1]WSI04658.1 M56 family metallopeptidase [Sedimentibacter sp. MB36-C1]